MRLWVKMSKKIFWIIILILILVLLGLFHIDTKDCILKTYRLNNEFWSSLISAIIGAIVTIYGIYWTISVENKKHRADLINSHKPYLRYFISIGIYPYRKIDQSKRTDILDYKIEFSQSPDKSLIFPLYVENIGLGHAFIEDIRIDEKGPSKSKRMKIIKKDDDSVFYVEIKNISKDEIKKIKLVVHYKDFFDTKYSDTIKVAFTKDGEPVLFDKNSAKEALNRYFEQHTVDKEAYECIIEEMFDQKNFIVKGLSYENMSKQGE